MGYTIRYSPETSKRYPISVRSKTWKYFFVLGIVGLILFFALKYRSEMIRFLIPGDPDVTADAFYDLMTNIREGNAGDAVTAFCREILDHAAG